MNERLAAIGLAPQAEEPVQIARPGAFLRQTVLVRDGRRRREALCELDASGLRVSGMLAGRSIAWRDARSITVERGCVQVISPIGSVSMEIALDGVSEPELLPLFARVLEEGRAGTLAPRMGALHELALGIDRALESFADADDPVVPLAIGAFATIAGLVLVVALPAALQLAARLEPAAGTFAILPRIAVVDPRVIVAGFAAAGALAVIVARSTLGPSAAVWARGTVRGWHRNAAGAEGLLRGAVARLMLAPRVAGLIAAAALLAVMPSAFARTVVDGTGVHEATGLPFLSRDRSWAELVEVVPLAVGFGERPEGFDVALAFSDGSRVSTRGRDLAGGSQRAFYDFAKARSR